MNIIGGYNFGVWNPPTSIESIRYFEQLNTNIAIKLINLQTGKEQGIRQSFDVEWPRFETFPDSELIAFLNDNNLKTFTGMRKQGWGGG